MGLSSECYDVCYPTFGSENGTQKNAVQVIEFGMLKIQDGPLVSHDVFGPTLLCLWLLGP